MAHSTSQTNSIGRSSSQPPTPFHGIFQQAEDNLNDLLTRKTELDRSLATLEASIFAYEGTYLNDTYPGNIIRGFNGYLAKPVEVELRPVTEKDRIFSNSSSTYKQSLEVKKRVDQLYPKLNPSDHYQAAARTYKPLGPGPCDFTSLHDI
ncbi:Chromatin modification- protein meaf6 [Dimargaris cristalligena]|nr:Chromatin modification- protein meaf6 [Dimargaris cristalligena]